MSAGGGNANLRTIALNLITNTCRCSRLRIDQLDIGNIYESFLFNDAAAAIALRIRALVTFDNADAFNFDLASSGRHFQHPATFTLVAARDYHNLIVFSDFGSLCSRHAR